MTYIFSHDQLLPHDITLVLDDSCCTIVLMQAGERVKQQQFTEAEWVVLMLLFRKQSSCTYAEALAESIGEPLDDCQWRLQAAYVQDEHEESVERKAFRHVMKPGRDLLVGCQERLHDLHLHITALLDYGYSLSRWTRGATL